MPYRVNGKNLAIGRLMGRGPDAEKRLKYLHVGPKGTTVVTDTVVARVTLPYGEPQPNAPVIIPQDEYDKITRPKQGSDEIVELPSGQPAATGPHFLVPNIDKYFPDPAEVEASFTCNAELLRNLLTAAIEVSEDRDSTCRLRFCPESNRLRIDIYRQPEKQEFVGTLIGLDYDGAYIPGEKPDGVVKPEKKPQQSGMALKVSTGRKFRGAGE